MSAGAIVLALTGVLLLAAPLCAKKPKVVVDPTADFTLYKTYAWVSGTAAPNPLMNTAITTTIDSELERGGLTRIEDIRKADLLVRYDVEGGAQVSYSASDPTYAASGGVPPPNATVWGTGSGAVAVQEGAIEVRLMDRVRQHVVWTSATEGKLDDQLSKRYQQAVEKVQELFKDFPPKKK